MAGALHAGRHAGPIAWRLPAARRSALVWVLVLLDLFVGLEAVGLLALQRTDPVYAGALPALGQAAAARPPQPAPVAIDIASIGVHSDLVPLGVDAAGVLGVPGDFSKAGWWTAGPKPGGDGAAVVVGHVDSYRGPAVFYRVRNLRPGALIAVRRVDGSSATFRVDALRQYAKDDLPARMIYGPTATPGLRLITCGGAFDRRSHSYEDNVVVFASIVEPGPTPATA